MSARSLAYERTTGFIRQRINNGHIRRFVIIAVNARTDPPEHLSERRRSPGLTTVFMKTATVSMENYSFDTIERMRKLQDDREKAQTDIAVCNELLDACHSHTKLPAFAEKVRTCFVEVNFEALEPRTVAANS